MKTAINHDLPVGEHTMQIVELESNDGSSYTFILDGDVDELRLGEKYKIVSQNREGKLVKIGIAPLVEVTQHKITRLERVCPNCGEVHDGVMDVMRKILSRSVGFI